MDLYLSRGHRLVHGQHALFNEMQECLHDLDFVLKELFLSKEGDVLTALLGRGHGGPESPLHGSHPPTFKSHQNEVC